MYFDRDNSFSIDQNLTRLQQLHQTAADSNVNADILRNLAFHYSFSRLDSLSTVSGGAYDKHAEKYENLVDSFDDMGLNNFAEGAISLCNQNNNENDKWVSSLDQQSCFKLDCFERFITRCQADTSHVLPSNCMGAPSPAWADTALWQQPLAKTSVSSLFPAEGRAQPPASSVSTQEVVCKARTLQPVFRTHHLLSAADGHGIQNAAAVRQERNREDTEHMAVCDPGRGSHGQGAFKTAKEQLALEQSKKHGQDRPQSTYSYGSSKRSLGTRRGPNNRFVPPVLHRGGDGEYGGGSGLDGDTSSSKSDESAPTDERLKGIEPKIIELISNEIMEHRPQMDWEDIAGLQFAKKTIQEIVVWPMLRPDIFTGLRGPPKGLLLFGPPGTGKTLIGKCIASQSRSTFFCISASSLTSKWVGEGEKMVRALFAVARCHQPAVIFIDEVDSLLSQRSDGEHEASRRIKTEFLVQLDGASTQSDDRILVIGATNRPQEIDEAARRRFVKRLYIPLPEQVARQHIITRLMSQQHSQLGEADVEAVGHRTEGFSGADMANLCREAALGPIRSIPLELMETIRPEQVRAITMRDFEAALQQVRPSVSAKDLDVYIEWNNTYGSFGL